MKYCHIGSKNDIAKIKRTKYLDNSKATSEKLSHYQLELYDEKKDTYLPLKAFIWNVEKMIESRYYPTFPFSKIMKTGFVGFRSIWDVLSLGFGTYFDVTGLSCIVFDVKNSSSIRDQYINQKYTESFSPVKLTLKNIQEISMDEACTQIFGMKKPYRPWRGSSLKHMLGSILGRKTYITRIVK